MIASTPKGFNSYLYEDYFAPTSRLNAIKIKYSLRDNPLITEEAIEELYRNYDHKMALQELEGEFVNLNDSAVYRSFSREFNLRDIEHNPTIKTYIGVDYNVGINASVVIQKINGIFYVVDEIYGLTTTQDLGRELMSRYTNFTVIDDATGNNRQIGDGLTQREILKQCGIRDIQSHNKNPERIDRYAVVNALFKNGKDEISLYISPKCKKLIGELESLAYKINTNTPDDRNNKAGHITDAMGYALYALTGGTIYPSRILQQRRV